MGRYALLLLLLAACPKKAKEAEVEPVGSGAPPIGRSVTKLNAGEEGPLGSGGAGRLEKIAAGELGSGDGGGAEPGSAVVKPAATLIDAGTAAAPADAALNSGGNGKPPYMDDEGHLHGPGGPVFMGRGPLCDADRDHCIRDGTWFAVGNLVAGKLYRAVPVYEYEKKWYNWRGKEESFAMRFKTKVGTAKTLRAGDPVIWFIDENASKKFVDNEYDALTSSRWEAGVIDNVGPDKIRVKGWTYGAVPIDTTRVIIETVKTPQ